MFLRIWKYAPVIVRLEWNGDHWHSQHSVPLQWSHHIT